MCTWECERYAVKSLLLSDARPGRSIPYISTWCQLILAAVFYKQNCHEVAASSASRLACTVVNIQRPWWTMKHFDCPLDLGFILWVCMCVWVCVCLCVCFIYTFNTQHHVGSHAIIHPQVCSWHLTICITQALKIFGFYVVCFDSARYNRHYMGKRSGAASWGTALHAERCWFDSRRVQWDFSLICSFRPQYGPGVDAAFNINEYQGYLLDG